MITLAALRSSLLVLAGLLMVNSCLVVLFVLNAVPILKMWNSDTKVAKDIPSLPVQAYHLTIHRQKLDMTGGTDPENSTANTERGDMKQSQDLIRGRSKRDPFKEIMTEHDRTVMKDLLEKFLYLADKSNLTYWLYSGSLLGSYRHHGPVPWDDDLDLIMPNAQKDKIRNVLQSVYPRYKLHTATFRWKFYSHNSAVIKEFPWRYPFIDITFYLEKDNKIWDCDPSFSAKFQYNKNLIFPLVKRPFWGHLVNAPKKTKAVLRKNFKISECATNSYNHKLEKFVEISRTRVSCDKLKNRFPFVLRRKTPDGVNETLQVGEEVIGWWLDQNPSSSQ